MAPRRRRRAISAAFGGLADASQVYAQMMGTRIAGQQAGERQNAADKQNFVETVLDKVMKGEYSPEQGSQALTLRGISPAGMNLDAAQPPMEDRMASISKDMASATNLSGLPTEQRVRRRMAAANVPTEAPIMAENPGTLNQFPLVGGTKPSDQLTSLMDELGATKANLQAQVPATPVEDIGPNGVGRRRYQPSNQLPQLGDLQTERTPSQEGQRAGQITEAQTPYDVASAVAKEEGTRGAKLETFRQETPLAAQRAGSEEGARIGAQGTPQALNILGQRAEIEANAKPPSDNERAAYDYGTRAAQAHAIMLKLEPVLARRGLLVNLVGLNNPDAIKDPTSRQYSIALRTFINSNLRRESGASISEPEFAGANQQYAFQTGTDQGSLKMKQENRRTTLKGLAGQAGSRLGGQFVTLQELQALATQRGTKLEDQIRRAQAERYQVIY